MRIAQHARHMVLEVRRLADLRPGNQLNSVRPFPSRLQDHPTYYRPADGDQLQSALRELAHLVGLAEILAFSLLHAPLLSLKSMRVLEALPRRQEMRRTT